MRPARPKKETRYQVWDQKADDWCRCNSEFWGTGLLGMVVSFATGEDAHITLAGNLNAPLPTRYEIVAVRVVPVRTRKAEMVLWSKRESSR